MVAIGWIIGLILGIGIGGMIQKTLNKCKHKWKLIESGNLYKEYADGTRHTRGFIKVYECEHCKQMRKEQASLD